MDPELNPTILQGNIQTIGADDFEVGSMVFDTPSGNIYIHDGTDWVQATQPEEPEPTEILREFVTKELTHDEKLQMITDWNHFEVKGAIGDCTLREVVDRWKKRTMNGPVADFFGPAKDIMFEVFRSRSEVIIDKSNVDPSLFYS